MDITTATPVEIDTELARIGGEIAKRHTVIDRATDTINMELRYPAPNGSINQRRIDECQSLITTASHEIEGLIAERAPLDAEFWRRGSWSRYFLVDNTNGHVHHNDSRSACSRQPSTTHIWLVEESGRPAGELVEDAGERACTVCFPWAPVEHLSRPSKFRTPTELEKQARAAEREARAVAKRAKQITNPDGTPLRILVGDGRHFDTVETVRAAEMRLVDIQFWAKLHGDALTGQDIANLATLVAALAVKQSKDEGTVRTEATVRLIKKCRREQVQY